MAVDNCNSPGGVFVIDSISYSRVKEKVSKLPPGKMEILGKKNFIYLFMVLVLVLIQKMEFIKHLEERMGRMENFLLH